MYYILVCIMGWRQSFFDRQAAILTCETEKVAEAESLSPVG